MRTNYLCFAYETKSWRLIGEAGQTWMSRCFDCCCVRESSTNHLDRAGLLPQNLSSCLIRRLTRYC